MGGAVEKPAERRPPKEGEKLTSPHLKWTDWRGQEFVHVLNSDEAVIGRKADAHVILDNINISRHHAKIIKTGQGHALVDLGSAHGTFLNDLPVQQQVILSHGDKNLLVISCWDFARFFQPAG